MPSDRTKGQKAPRALRPVKPKRGQAPAPAPRDPRKPFWVPEGVDLDFVPAEVQQAVAELIEPVYQQFVLGAADGLERSLGVTITHLLWLEILEQFDLKQEYTQVQSVLGMAGNRQDLIAQHLRLIDSKLRVGYFLVRLREFRQRQSEDSPVPPPIPKGKSPPRLPLPDPQSLFPRKQRVAQASSLLRNSQDGCATRRFGIGSESGREGCEGGTQRR